MIYMSCRLLFKSNWNRGERDEVDRCAVVGAQQILMPTIQQGLSFPQTPSWDDINSEGFQSTKFIEFYAENTKVL